MSAEVNRTELQKILREKSGANPFREAARLKIEDAIEADGEVPLCPLTAQRDEMERHIRKNYRRLRTQLPGCNGRCTSYGCPNIIVMRCWNGIKDDIL